VLIVDGDENVLRLLGLKLRRAGFAVDAAGTGAEALAAIRSSPPDVALLGKGLDDGSLEGLAGAIRASTGNRPAIVVLSPEADAVAIQAALAHGADDYVLKPFSPREVVHRVHVALLRRWMRLDVDP
jgi:DNA-binding response OmpR family regulator